MPNSLFSALLFWQCCLRIEKMQFFSRGSCSGPHLFQEETVKPRGHVQHHIKSVNIIRDLLHVRGWKKWCIYVLQAAYIHNVPRPVDVQLRP